MFGLGLKDSVFVPSGSDVLRRLVRAIVCHHILKPSHTPIEAGDSELRNVFAVDVEQEVSPVVVDAMFADEFDAGIKILGDELLEVFLGVVIAKESMRPHHHLREGVRHCGRPRSWCW